MTMSRRGFAARIRDDLMLNDRKRLSERLGISQASVFRALLRPDEHPTAFGKIAASRGWIPARQDAFITQAREIAA